VTARLTAALAVACLLPGSGAAAAPPLTSVPPTSAEGYAVSVTGPDGSGLAGTQGGGSFAYPADGSIVSAGSTLVSSSANPDDGTAYARTELTDVSLFGGEITVSSLRAAVTASGTSADLSDSGITNLIVLGQSVSAPSPDLELALADWGSLSVLRESTSQSSGFMPAWQGSVTALLVHLDADHLGFARGSTIRIGFAAASGHSPQPTPTTMTTSPGTSTTSPGTSTTSPGTSTTSPGTSTSSSAGHKAGGPKPRARPRTATTPLPGAEVGLPTPGEPRAVGQTKRRNGLPVRTTIPDVTPKLTAKRYVFPVYGPSAYGDTFGAPRGDVSGGWHHGDDIFAPLGAPVLAVADGTVFSVGWNDIGGWRLWLRDTAGDEFYYAHLSAYTALAVNGRNVKAGDVLGFVGNTGDAATTPFHLHFEVHPVSLLFLGYDGAVNPTKYLDAWRRLEDIRIRAAVPFSLLPVAAGSSAPTPGAILLSSSDISTANGLDPDSLRRAMNATRPIEEVPKPTVGDLPVPLPVLDRA
jgi:murein DD-endopeptidase MepM/ murein hydrolase activator NlpD